MLKVLRFRNSFFMLDVLLDLIWICWSSGGNTLFDYFLVNKHLRNSRTLKLFLKVLHRYLFSPCLLSDDFRIVRYSLSFSKFRFDVKILSCVLALVDLLILYSHQIWFRRKLHLITCIFSSARRKSYFFLLLCLKRLMTSWLRMGFCGMFLF